MTGILLKRSPIGRTIGQVPMWPGLASMALLASCAPASPPAASPTPPSAAGGACDAAPAQSKIGIPASASLGAELLSLSGARTLRWVAPGMAVTMDFRPDRLTVSYDETMAIVRISCG